MDASQYKDYVLVLLFIKYISDKYANQPYAPITIPAGASFPDMVALKGKSDIGDQINKRVIAKLANANQLSDMPDFNDATKLGTGKAMVDRLTNLIAIFENKALDFSKNRADGDDILGDAYEYLMRHFATESGKSKGQFYTPAEVSRIIARIIGIHDARTSASTAVYDPTCGSGSLLLKVSDEAVDPCHALRAGEGCRHQRPRPDEHDPARQSDGTDRAGQYADGPQVQGGWNPQNLRLCRRQSAILGQAVEHGAGSDERSLRTLQILRHAARQAGRLRLPATYRPVPQEHRQRRLHPAARRAVPGQRRGGNSSQSCAQGLHQGHRRPARQPLLRHRYTRLHSGHRQGRTPSRARASS